MDQDHNHVEHQNISYISTHGNTVLNEKNSYDFFFTDFFKPGVENQILKKCSDQFRIKNSKFPYTEA